MGGSGNNELTARQPARWEGPAWPSRGIEVGGRGVILRGTGWHELWSHSQVLWGMGVAMFVLSLLKFHTRLA